MHRLFEETASALTRTMKPADFGVFLSKISAPDDVLVMFLEHLIRNGPDGYPPIVLEWISEHDVELKTHSMCSLPCAKVLSKWSEEGLLSTVDGRLIKYQCVIILLSVVLTYETGCLYNSCAHPEKSKIIDKWRSINSRNEHSSTTLTRTGKSGER